MKIFACAQVQNTHVRRLLHKNPTLRVIRPTVRPPET